MGSFLIKRWGENRTVVLSDVNEVTFFSRISVHIVLPENDFVHTTDIIGSNLPLHWQFKNNNFMRDCPYMFDCLQVCTICFKVVFFTLKGTVWLSKITTLLYLWEPSYCRGALRWPVHEPLNIICLSPIKY